MPPNRSTVSAAMRSQSAALGDVGDARSGAAELLRRRLAGRSRRAPAITTLAPARANTPAMPLPMPLVPPVTSTVRPVRGVNTSAIS